MFNKKMMNKMNYKRLSRYFSLTLLACACLQLGACSSEGDLSPEGSRNVESIDISMAKRVIAAAADDKTVEPEVGFNLKDLIPYNLQFDENSIVQVSQQTRTMYPFLTQDEIYDFKYMKDEEASWDDEISYNFRAANSEETLEWNKIQDTGSFDGGFALYCMYFPIENQLRQRQAAGGANHYYVLEDQSTIENLMKSDILGAYHHTPSIFSRIRFRLFHLMTYVRVRLYVPVFESDKNTGYREGALQYATIDNVTPEFAIEWNAVPSSDSQGPAISPLSGDGSIKMYQHPLKAGEKEHPIVKLPYQKFLPSGYFDQGITGDYDNVRVYDFSVLIPNQKGTIDPETGQETVFTNTDFLNFYFRTNSGASTRYFFNQSYIGSISQDKENPQFQDLATLNMNQGYFQYLELYVPRVGNQVIFLGSKVLPWTQVGSEMLLHRDDDK